METKKSKSDEFISCVCITCGVRNDHSDPQGFCQNGHDDWLEYRDFQPEGEVDNKSSEVIDRAMSTFNMSYTELENQFMNSSITQFTVYGQI